VLAAVSIFTVLLTVFFVTSLAVFVFASLSDFQHPLIKAITTNKEITAIAIE